MKKILTSVSIVLLLIFLAAGCDGSSLLRNHPDSSSNVSKEEQASPVEKQTVDLLVTRDFGAHIVFAKTVEYKENTTILDVMKAHLQVETAYGGSFINAINGLASSAGSGEEGRQDWFYYINGIACDVGVLDYDLRDAGSVWWDYHNWQLGPAITAVIGSYPQPFLNGYRGEVKPTLIMCSAADAKRGRLLMETMETSGVSRIDMANHDDKKIKNREGPTIVLGKWDDLKKLSYLDEFNQDYQRNGSGIHFSDQYLELLDYNGQAVKKLDGSAGVIIAAGEGLGDDSPLWLVSGTDEAAWQNALDILVKHPAKLKQLYGAAVVGEEVIALPVQ